MNVRLEGRMGGCMDGRMEGKTKGRIRGRMDESKKGIIKGKMNVRIKEEWVEIEIATNNGRKNGKDGIEGTI